MFCFEAALRAQLPDTFSIVNTKSFAITFDSPNSTMTGLIVAIYESTCCSDFKSSVSRLQ